MPNDKPGWTGPGEHAGTLLGILMALMIGALLVMLLGAHAAQAQGAGDVIITPPASAPQGFSATGSDITWPLVAAGAVKMMFDALRSVIDRWLDRTGGRIRIEYTRKVVTDYGGAILERPTDPGPSSPADPPPTPLRDRRR